MSGEASPIDAAARACSKNDLGALQELLKKWITSDSTVPQFTFKVTPRRSVPLLSVAVACDSLNCMTCLIKAGADVRQADGSGAEPVHWACTGGRVNALSLLLSHGADANPTRNASVAPPLAICAKHDRLDCARLLLENGAPVDRQDGMGRSALHLASWFNFSRFVPLLLQFHARIDLKDQSGDTPLHLAARFGQVETCEVLVERGAPVDAQERVGRAPLHFAVQHNRPLVAQLLLRAGADRKLKNCNGKTPERLARAEDRIEILEMMQQCRAPARPDHECLKEREVAEEHGRMKAEITKLADGRDAQVEQYTIMRDLVQKHGLTLGALQQKQIEMRDRITKMQVALRQVLVTMNQIPGETMSREPPAPARGPVLHLCRMCGGSGASRRCKQCRSPICEGCILSVEQGGCPFCARK